MTKTNKSVKALVGLFIFSFLFASKAIADDKRFYGGLDISRQEMSLDATQAGLYSVYFNGSYLGDFNIAEGSSYYKNKSIIPVIFAGLDDGKNLKLELSYSQSSEGKSITNTISTNSETKTQTIGLDFKPYAKINDKFSAYGILGLSYNKIEIEENFYYLGSSYSQSESLSKLAPTLGFGAEYFLASNVAVRTQFKYTHLNAKTPDSFGIKEIKSVTNLNIGVGYYF